MWISHVHTLSPFAIEQQPYGAVTRWSACRATLKICSRGPGVWDSRSSTLRTDVSATMSSMLRPRPGRHRRRRLRPGGSSSAFFLGARAQEACLQTARTVSSARSKRRSDAFDDVDEQVGRRAGPKLLKTAGSSTASHPGPGFSVAGRRQLLRGGPCPRHDPGAGLCLTRRFSYRARAPRLTSAPITQPWTPASATSWPTSPPGVGAPGLPG